MASIVPRTAFDGVTPFSKLESEILKFESRALNFETEVLRVETFGSRVVSPEVV